MKKVSLENPYVKKYDLSNCEEEPIHQIQTVQSFAGLIAVDLDSYIIRQTSTNIASFIPFSPKDILQKPLTEVFPESVVDLIKVAIREADSYSTIPVNLSISSSNELTNFAVLHLSDKQFIIEIEQDLGIENSLQILQKIDKAVQNVYAAKASADLFEMAAKEIKLVTGYDRVMIYEFDENYHGQVIAEAKNDALTSFLDIRYPASDIPKQARDLFLANQIRLIADVNDELSFITPSIHPQTKQPLNVGQTASRGSSPIHLEYLRNMGVKATLTVAIVENGKLWGLIACHHYAGKKMLDFRTRNLVRFFAQILAGHLSLARVAENQRYLLKNKQIQNQLFKQIEQQKDLVGGLLEGEKNILDYIAAAGAAIVFDKKIRTIGITPDDQQIEDLVKRLPKKQDMPESSEEKQLIYSTESIVIDLPDWKVDTKKIAGLLAVNISHKTAEYIIWFRQSLDKEIIWGGNPDKAMVNEIEKARLSPRKSFEKWKQVVQNTSATWLEHERNAAISLRNDIKDVVLKRFLELQQLHEELKLSYQDLETYSYTVSHDLRSPLRNIEGFAQILMEDYSDKLDDYGVEVIQIIIDGINQMNQFINDILMLSRVSKTNLKKRTVVVADFLKNKLTDLNLYPNSNPNTIIKFSGTLPDIQGDPTMIRQVFLNLLGNAIKYSKGRSTPIVEVEGKQLNGKVVYTFKDNGIGFDMKYANIIFEVFNRLDVEAEFKGTGIGLSIVKRVMKCHQGTIEVESEPNKGATFIISFPA